MRQAFISQAFEEDTELVLTAEYGNTVVQVRVPLADIAGKAREQQRGIVGAAVKAALFVSGPPPVAAPDFLGVLELP